MKLTDKLRELIILMRVQSLPLTVITLLISYLTVSDELLTTTAYHLVVVGTAGHIGFYLMNEILDVDHDKFQGKMDKPLVSGAVNIYLAKFLMLGFISSSFLLSAYWLPTLSFVFFVVAMLFGTAYNIKSKTSPYALVWLGLWGVAIVATGSFAAGGFNLITLLVSLLMFVHMELMTVVGDYKDLDSEEASLLKEMNCHVFKDNGVLRAFKSFKFMGAVYNPLALIQSALIILIPVGAYVVETSLVALVFLPVGVLASEIILRKLEDVIKLEPFHPHGIKRKIVIYEAVFVVAFVAITVSFTAFTHSLILGVSTMIWGLGWQQLLYGDALFFSS